MSEIWWSVSPRWVSESCWVVSDSLQPLGLYSPWNSPGQNTGMGSLSLLQGIFLKGRSQGSSLVAQLIKNMPAIQETQVQFLGWEYTLEKEMATHSSILAWRTLWTEKPGGLQSMESQESDTTEQLNHHHSSRFLKNSVNQSYLDTPAESWESHRKKDLIFENKGREISPYANMFQNCIKSLSSLKELSFSLFPTA